MRGRPLFTVDEQHAVIGGAIMPHTRLSDVRPITEIMGARPRDSAPEAQAAGKMATPPPPPSQAVESPYELIPLETGCYRIKARIRIGVERANRVALIDDLMRTYTIRAWADDRYQYRIISGTIGRTTLVRFNRLLFGRPNRR